jgi:hypothetical protein
VLNTIFSQKAGRFTLTEMVAELDIDKPEGGETHEELSREATTVAGREAIVRVQRWSGNLSGKRDTVQCFLVADGFFWGINYIIHNGDNERPRDEALAVVKSLKFLK